MLALDWRDLPARLRDVQVQAGPHQRTPLVGKWEHVTPQSHTAEQLAAWDRQLSDAVDLLGYGDRAVSAPGWLCIPDLAG